VIIGLGALVCGGVAGYVALTTTGPAVVERPAPPAEDPSSIEALAEKIIAIDLPAGFEPYHSEKNMYMKVAEFARKDSDAALVLGRADLSALPATRPDEAQSTLLSLMDRHRRHDTALITAGADSPHSTREFTVLHKVVPFQFMDGTVPASGTSVRRASGTFRTREAYIAIIYTVPAAEFDETAFAKLLESIRPAADDSTVDAAAADDAGEGVPQSTGAQSPAGESSKAATRDGSR
jgi:hypothetical protein